MSKRIFISYGEEDGAYAREIYDFLQILQEKHPGVTVFWDVESVKPGEDKTQKIDSALETADIFVCLYSKEYFKTDAVKKRQLPVICHRTLKGDCELFGFLISTYPYEDLEFNGLSLGDHKIIGPYDKNDNEKAFDTFRKAKQNQILYEVYKRIRASLYPDDSARPANTVLSSQYLLNENQEPTHPDDSSSATEEEIHNSSAHLQYIEAQARSRNFSARLDRQPVIDAINTLNKQKLFSLVIRCEEPDWPEAIGIRLNKEKHIFGNKTVKYCEVDWAVVPQNYQEFEDFIWGKFISSCAGQSNTSMDDNLDEEIKNRLKQFINTKGVSLVVNYRIDLRSVPPLKALHIWKLCRAWQKYLDDEDLNGSVFLLFTLLLPEKSTQDGENNSVMRLTRELEYKRVCSALYFGCNRKFKKLKALDTITEKHFEKFSKTLAEKYDAWHINKKNVQKKLFPPKQNKEWSHSDIRDELEKIPEFVSLFSGQM